MKKKYSIKYYKDDKPIIRTVSNYPELNVLLSGDAAGCFCECKFTDPMPVKMHNLVAAHNEKLLTSNSTTGKP